MLVKNLVNWAGDRFAYEPGDVIDMPDDIARDRIKAGLAAAHNGKPELPAVKIHPAADKADAA